jgi:hypothetical protein
MHRFALPKGPKRKRYSAAFKAKVALEAIRGEQRLPSWQAGTAYTLI